MSDQRRIQAKGNQMKTLASHINEALKIGKNLSKFSTHSCQPKTTDELQEIINERMSDEGPECDLNDIDVSLIEDMSAIFYRSSFNGDISKWNTSKVTNMMGMFASSEFNGNISNWDVGNVIDMAWMFNYSSFNQDISKWKINKDCDTYYMLLDCRIKEEYKPKSLQK